MKRFIFGVILSVLWTMCSWADGAAETVDYDFIDDVFAYGIRSDVSEPSVKIICFASEEVLNEITGNDLTFPETVLHDGVEYTVSRISSNWCDYIDSESGERVSVPYVRLRNCHIPKYVSVYTFNVPGGDICMFQIPILCESFTVADDNFSFKAIDGVLLTRNGKMLVRYPLLCREEVWKIPDGVEEIPYTVFMLFCDCFKYMEEVEAPKILKLPSTLTTIGYDLRTFPADVKVEFDPSHEYFEAVDNFIIDKRDASLQAVVGLNNMDKIVLPDAVKYIKNNNALSSYDRFAPGEKENYYWDMYQSHAPVVLPETLETIDNYAFEGVGSREIHLPKSVTQVGSEILYQSGVRCLEIEGNPQTVERSFFNFCFINYDYKADWGDEFTWGTVFFNDASMGFGSLELVELGSEPTDFHGNAFFMEIKTLMTEHPLRHLVSHIEDPFAEWPTATPSELFTFDLRAPHWGILWVPEGTGARYAEAVAAGIWPKCERIREIGDGLIVMCEPVNSSFHFDEVVEDTGIRVSYEHTYAVGDVEFDRFDGFRSSDESVATIDEEGRLVLHGEGETLITAVSLDTEGREYAHEYHVSVGPNSETDIVEMPIQSTDAAYYTLQGQFAGTDPSGLSSGLYVRREAGVATKILIP